MMTAALLIAGCAKEEQAADYVRGAKVKRCSQQPPDVLSSLRPSGTYTKAEFNAFLERYCFDKKALVQIFGKPSMATDSFYIFDPGQLPVTDEATRNYQRAMVHFDFESSYVKSVDYYE